MHRSLAVFALASLFIGCSSSTTTSGNDAGSDGGGTDGGTDSGGDGAAAATVNGCKVGSDFVTSPTTVSFAGIAYTPKCLSVAAGTKVTFSGTFSVHPLTPGKAPSQPDPTVPANQLPTNVIVATSSGTMVDFTFTAPGYYPYYCAVHESAGMFGAIEVK